MGPLPISKKTGIQDFLMWMQQLSNLLMSFVEVLVNWQELRANSCISYNSSLHK